MKEYLLGSPLTGDFFAYLGNFGKVETLPTIGNGFYRFDKPDWFSIRGLSGDNTVEVRFRKEVMDLTSDFLYLLFKSYPEETRDLSLLRQMEHATGERVSRFLYGNR